MSLFPAYAAESESGGDAEPLAKIPRQTPVVYLCEDSADAEVSSISEEQLLDSDSEHEQSPDPPQCYSPSEPTAPEDFYEDKKLDRANIGVSTLYTPGRPLYTYTDEMVGLPLHKTSSKHKSKRYYIAAKKLPNVTLEPHALLRNEVTLLEKAIHQDPQNLQIWNKYLDYQMQRGQAALLSSLELADSMKVTRGPLLPRLLRISHLGRPAREHLQLLRDLLATSDRSWSPRGLVWTSLLWAVSRAGDSTFSDVTSVAAAAVADRLPMRDYLTVQFLYGCFLANAGLWETLVRLIELVCAMNLAALPETSQRTVELTEAEDKICSSGLPLDVVWRRVETLRAAAFWRPADTRQELGADPQRVVQAADVADLLLPVVTGRDKFTLAANIFRWLGIPLIPPLLGCTSLPSQTLHGPSSPLTLDALGLGADAVLLQELSRADLSPRLPASDRGGAALLAAVVEPPGHFTDQFGFMTWSRTVCDSVTASLSACPSAHSALTCVRLRYMRAQAMLAQEEDERTRICKQARQLLKENTSPSPVAAAEFALVQAAGRADPTGSGGKLAALALRSSLTDVDTTAVHRIYVARIVGRIFGEKSNTSRWALSCAVLGRTLPSHLDVPPPRDVMQAALLQCQERCASIEAEISSQLADDEEHSLEPWWSLLAGEEQWPLARSCLHGGTCPHEWAESSNLRAVRYHHAVSVGSRAASMFASHPHDFTLGTLWGSQKGWLNPASLPPASPVSAMCHILPYCRVAAQRDWPPDLCHTCVRVCSRALQPPGASSAGTRGLRGVAARGAGGGAAARGAGGAGGGAAAWYEALDLHPLHKWLVVSGAWVGLGREAADLLLEKQLRLHALPDELVPL